MGQPTWRVIATITVPDPPGSAWTPVLDYVTQGKLYRIGVNTDDSHKDQRWNPEASGEEGCTADGDPGLTRKDQLLLDSVAPGALVAKIGGSTADLRIDKDRVALFSVGRHCVFSVVDPSKVGSLYLGINDKAGTKIKGQLKVTICEAL